MKLIISLLFGISAIIAHADTANPKQILASQLENALTPLILVGGGNSGQACFGLGKIADRIDRAYRNANLYHNQKSISEDGLASIVALQTKVAQLAGFCSSDGGVSGAVSPGDGGKLQVQAEAFESSVKTVIDELNQ